MMTRNDYELRYRIFDKFALNDQRKYYTNKTDLFRTARHQVNIIRASMGLLTGLATALAVLLASTAYAGGCSSEVMDIAQRTASSAVESAERTLALTSIVDCSRLRGFTGLLAAASIILPAIAGFFGAIQSLYQWDRFVQIYKDALENLEAADAQLTARTSEIPDDRFLDAYVAYTEGTLEVMASETSQWGQSIKTPAQIEAFVERQVNRAKQVQRGVTGEGGKEFENPDGSFG
jgi:hypothetical protein